MNWKVKLFSFSACSAFSVVYGSPLMFWDADQRRFVRFFMITYFISINFSPYLDRSLSKEYTSWMPFFFAKASR